MDYQDRSNRIQLDPELMAKALKIVPDLELVVFAGMRARSLGITYPILDYDQLLQLFGGADSVVFLEHRVTQDQARTYFRKEFFPVESEDDLLRKVYEALATQAADSQPVRSLMVEPESQEYRGHRIELRAREVERQVEHEIEPELLIDGRPVYYGQLPDGLYFLDENAYEWGDSLMDLARAFVDRQSRAEETGPEREAERGE